MKEIKFNSISKTKNNLEHLLHLFLDYENLRKKVFSLKCLENLQPTFPNSKLYLTHSATGALEMVAQYIGIKPGDEVIIPSLTFVSTANAFVIFGAIPRFVDCDPEYLNISVIQIEEAINEKTKAIIAMHYMGHPCEMAKLKAICLKYNLILIEDAATGFGNNYQGNALGTIGDFGVISFDSTKHISAIQGGLLIINNPDCVKRMDNIYHIGTNRNSFENGEVSHYDWVDVGSKYQLNELNAAFLYDQLQQKEMIFSQRKLLSQTYDELLRPLTFKNHFRLMPLEMIESNIHGYYIILKSKAQRNQIQNELKLQGIESFSHYRPLHLSPKGSLYANSNSCPNSSFIAETLLRLPLHNELNVTDVENVCSIIHKFLD